MRNVRIPMMALLGVSVLWAIAGPTEVAADRGRDNKIVMEDDCDPDDEAWAPTGGCLRKKGTVTQAEFALFSFTPPPFLNPPLGTPFAKAVIGHPSWRNDPGYLVVEADERLKVENDGGRGHTFTPVEEFGGGFVAPLSFGLTTAPECTAIAGDASKVIAPGRRATVTGLTPGDHKFMCCIHPWMRTLVKVTEDDHHHGK